MFAYKKGNKGFSTTLKYKEKDNMFNSILNTSIERLTQGPLKPQSWQVNGWWGWINNCTYTRKTKLLPRHHINSQGLQEAGASILPSGSLKTLWNYMNNGFFKRSMEQWNNWNLPTWPQCSMKWTKETNREINYFSNCTHLPVGAHIIVFFPSGAGKASSSWKFLGFNSYKQEALCHNRN